MKGQRPTPVGSLPLPQFIPEQERSRLISEVATFITADTDVSHYFNVAKEAIAGYSQDTLHRIMGNLSKPHMNLLVHGFTMDWDEAKINDYISIAEVVSDNDIYSGELENQLQALSYYEDLTPVQPGHPYPLERALQCHAIVAAVSAIHWHADEDSHGVFTTMDDGEFIPYIQDPKLRALILYSDNRNDIARIIKERGITEVEVIMEFLHSEAPAVADGML
jgi:hypothetical protein